MSFDLVADLLRHIAETIESRPYSLLSDDIHATRERRQAVLLLARIAALLPHMSDLALDEIATLEAALGSNGSQPGVRQGRSGTSWHRELLRQASETALRAHESGNDAQLVAVRMALLHIETQRMQAIERAVQDAGSWLQLLRTQGNPATGR
jgi:hypothetical protein